jgi:cyclic pyranopterin phosphate synthase
MDKIIDRYGRSFKTLRISLLNRCNLSCPYCNVGEKANDNHVTSPKEIAVDDLLQIVEKLHHELDLKTIRLTGGEPLLYSDLIPVIKGIRSMGILDIKLTTNGFLLERLALPMKQAGMQSINVSLDAMDEDVFFLMSKRNNVTRILNGIEAAITAGLKVKINTVIMKGMNESQLLPLLEYAFSKRLPIRFLEVMAMGHLYNHSKKYLFTQEEILKSISERYRIFPVARDTSSTANYWRTDSGDIFGIIANESQPFCHDCNRLRLDSHGNIYGCLSSNEPISLKGIDDKQQIKKKLQAALLQKQPLRFTGSELSMLDIGG